MPILTPPAIPVGALAALGQPVLRMEGGGMLRPWRAADGESVMEAYADPHIQRWHVRRADSVREARRWITMWRRAWSAEQAGHWAVASDDGERVLGRLALKSWDLFDGAAEVAYWTMPAARGTGVCTRALRTATRWALEEGGFHRLELEHSTANPASCQVARKAGYEAEGFRRKAAQHADGWHDMHLHSRVLPFREAAHPDLNPHSGTAPGVSGEAGGPQ